MKIRKIAFENHNILGNITFDFTDNNGNTVDTIIIAGENGCGKSVFLNELFQYNPAMNYTDRVEKIETEFEISETEKKLIQERLKYNHLPLICDNIITIKHVFAINNYKDPTVTYHIEPNKTERTVSLFSLWNDNLFKTIFSDIKINFTPNQINHVTSKNIDEFFLRPIKSSDTIATEITQLLIDIDDLDNADLAKWVKQNPNVAPPEDVQSTRMKRFTNAFHSIFPNKRYVGIANNHNRKVVEFEEYGKRMSIENLSSGEKQIVFRGGFLLQNQKTSEGAVILVDEPELSLHPKWQIEILSFLKKLFTNSDGQQTSQLIVATHSPFIIHNATRANDKVIVMKKDENGKVYVSQNPEYYSWTEAQLVREAFNIQPYIDKGKINVFVEGETDEKYYNKAMDVFGVDKDKISFKWIGRNNPQGGTDNSGDRALNSAVSFFKANPSMAIAPIVMFYDCDTNKPVEDDNNLHIRTMNRNNQNSLYKKGVENLLILPTDFAKDQFYSTKEITDDYGGIASKQSLDKMKLCDYFCSLGDDELKTILGNLNSEIQKLLLI